MDKWDCIICLVLFTLILIQGYKQEKTEIVLDNVIFVPIKNTGSMEPCIYKDMIGIAVTSDNFEIGDIISYNVNYTKYPKAHRIVDFGNDADGYYFITKGDSGKIYEKVYKEQIKYKIIGLIFENGN